MRGRELTGMEKGSTELDAIFKWLYEDSVLNRIAIEQFRTGFLGLLSTASPHVTLPLRARVQFILCRSLTCFL